MKVISFNLLFSSMNIFLDNDWSGKISKCCDIPIYNCMFSKSDIRGFICFKKPNLISLWKSLRLFSLLATSKPKPSLFSILKILKHL